MAANVDKEIFVGGQRSCMQGGDLFLNEEALCPEVVLFSLDSRSHSCGLLFHRVVLQAFMQLIE